MSPSRIDWVDYAKGICITLVVMMHATLSWGVLVNEEGWLHHVVEFARPFRMPDFFLLSGLFLGLSINAPLREYVDRKVVHFVYFYVIWLVIQMTLVESEVWRADPMQFGADFLVALTYEPYETLWFVHMLAIFYVVTRLLRHIPVVWVLLGAAALQTFYHAGLIDAGWTINRFCDRYIYFFVGYAAATRIFEFAAWAQARPWMTGALLAAWGVWNGVMVHFGLADYPGTSLLMGFIGAAAVVLTGALLSRTRFASPIAYIGANSIVVYLTFFFPVKVMHKVLLATNAIPDVGWAALTITAVAVVTPLMFHYVIKNTPLNFLYVRPQAFRLIKEKSKAVRGLAAADGEAQPNTSAARGAK